MKKAVESQDFTLPNLKTDSYYNIPLELQQLKQWVVHKNKVPYQINGKPAKSNEPDTWGSFENVVQAVRSGQFHGIGFMFSKEDEYLGIDIDKCYFNGRFNETAEKLIDSLDSYTEFSVSGTGVHIIVKGSLPEHIKQTGVKNSKYGVEVYGHGRYFTMTGNLENENEIQERTDEVAETIDEYFTKEQLAQSTETLFNTESFNLEDDSETWRKMFADPKTGHDIQAMYKGELVRKGDWSDTDYYLCQELAYYSGKDFVKMDRMFRNTGLYREKWDRKTGEMTYGERTMIRAAASKKKTVSDYKKTVDDFKLIVLDQESDSPNRVIAQLKTKLEQNPNTGKFSSNARNLEKIFSSPLFKNSIGYDLFRQRDVIFKDLLWRKKYYKDKKYEQWLPEDDNQLMHWLNKHFDIKGKEVVINAFVHQAHRNSFHPVKEFIESAEWDKQPRIEKFFIDFLGAEDNDYVRAVTRKWFVAAVKRIYEPGCKFDYMPVLVGGQGVGKSSTIAKIGGEWFSDSLGSLETKEAGEILQGSWILEIAELSAMKRSEEEEIKKFLSKQVDSFRPAYARVVVDNPRHCVFIGTTNTRDFLKDTTGNRRFLPIEVSENKKYDPFNDLTENLIHQLWAEAYELYKNGENIDLENELKEVAKEIQLEYTERDPRQGKIEDYLNRLLPEHWDTLKPYERLNWMSSGKQGTVKRTKVCAAEIWAECLGKTEDISVLEARKINGILRLLGWEQRKPARTRFKYYGSQTTFVRPLQ